MINLSKSPLGINRKAVIESVSFEVSDKVMTIVFSIHCIDNAGKLLTDKAVNQNRKITYHVLNENFVNAQFDPLNEGDQGARKEFEYFFELMQTIPLPSLILQLGEKLNERGIFN